MASDDLNNSGLAYWVLMSLIAIATFIYIGIWSFQNNSAKGIAIGLIFLSMIFAGLIFALLSERLRRTIFDQSSWGDNTLSFTVGFFLWLGLGKLSVLQSVVSLPKQYLFASISSELPQILEFSVNGVLVPIAEEIFWIIAIPFAVILFMNSIGKAGSLWENKYLQIAVITIIGAITFAYFHVGAAAFVGFIIIAIIFRSFMVVTIYSEQSFNWMKRVNLVPAFSIGAHMANNLSTYGWTQIKLIISSNFWPVGFLIIAFLLVMFGSGLERIISLILGKEKTVTSS